jgi:YVTN family beta-propeller protein
MSAVALASFLVPVQAHAGTGPLIYVSNYLSNTVSAIDPATGATVTTIPTGANPAGEVTGRYVYVANNYGSSVTAIDPTTNTVAATIPVSGYANMLALSPDGTRLYVNDLDGNLTVVSTATNTVIATVPGFAEPQGMAVSPDGTRLYVVNTNYSNPAGWVSVVDTSTSTYSIVATIPTSREPADIALTPDGSKAYVTDNGGVTLGSTVLVIDTSTNTVTGTIAVGVNPFGITMNAAGTRAYVANANYWDGGNTNSVTGSVSVIDTSSDSVTATIPTGYVPDSPALSPDGASLYVANDLGNNLTVIDTATNSVTGTISTGNHPFGVTFGPVQPTAAQLLAALYQSVQGVGPGSSLADKVASAQSYLASGDVPDACSTLSGFVSEVRAQSGKQIPSSTASALIADAQHVQAVIPC